MREAVATETGCHVCVPEMLLATPVSSRQRTGSMPSTPARVSAFSSVGTPAAAAAAAAPRDDVTSSPASTQRPPSQYSSPVVQTHKAGAAGGPRSYVPWPVMQAMQRFGAKTPRELRERLEEARFPRHVIQQLLGAEAAGGGDDNDDDDDVSDGEYSDSGVGSDGELAT